MSEYAICWKNSRNVYALLGVASLLLLGGFWDTIGDMVHRWDTKEEYGYGYMIPLITVFLIWQRKNEIARQAFEPTWLGMLVAFFAVLLFFLGAVATTHTLSQYAMVLMIMGIALSLMGWQAFKLVAAPLAILFFMVPLPPFIFNNLSGKLQLISSELGVAVIRMFDISVNLEGNVIDLGVYKLQVVEACSGLRYLFPLMVLAFLVAYLYKAEFWKKAVIFFSSIPITVLMNSFRIGVIGVLVEYYGIEQAEGFLHDFEGWIIFMACIAILVLEMVVLSKMGKSRGALSEVFAIDLPDKMVCREVRTRDMSAVYYAVLVAAMVVLGGAFYAQTRTDIHVPRKEFVEFPFQLGDWRSANSDVLEQDVLDSLKLDDYALTDYRLSGSKSVNFYAAYYKDQVAGEAAHSPRACIPGGGWLIKDHREIELADIPGSKEALKVNRMIIKKGEYTQVVYYWFQQRGRVIANEYMVKWYLFWDALTRNRTDGALVRLTTLVMPDETVEEGEKRLRAFAAEAVPQLPAFIPD
ncbi:MAG TPA: VPLPA-CTERM-specific exosortase XrtD [Gammaproteobacteria bacterium]